jgi:hypothetical protein
LAEIHPGPTLKTLLWHGSHLAQIEDPTARAEALHAYQSPPFRRSETRARTTWRDRASAVDLVVRALGRVAGYDLDRIREALLGVGSESDLDRAVSLFDATLIAGTTMRYLESPETCVFVGQREQGYTILPADAFVRQQVLRDGAPEGAELFPATSLRERLSRVSDVRSLDLLSVRGRPERLVAVFREPPLYEFDNRDEMLWWKHCRHVSGPGLPTEGLCELSVRLGRFQDHDERPLRLVRSRHRTLSFRFDRPVAWRAQLPTRDGKVYSFRVLQAVYETSGEGTARAHS